jgi:hypothetical protein
MTSLARCVVVALLLTCASRSVAQAGPATEPPRERDVGYALALSAAYAAAFAAGGALLADDDAVLGSALLLAPPAAVHLLYRDALWALLSIVGPATSVVATFLIVLPALGATGNCALRYAEPGPAPCFGVAAYASVLGYLGWAVVDVLASTRRGRR